MKSLLLTVAILACTTLLFTGCGESGSSGPPSNPDREPGASVAPEAEATDVPSDPVTEENAQAQIDELAEGIDAPDEDF